MPEEHGGREKRRDRRLRLELPVEAQIGSGGFTTVQIVDISSSGLQLWCDDMDDLEELADGDEPVEFEVRFRAKLAWCRPMEDDRSYLTGWEIERDGG